MTTFLSGDKNMYEAYNEGKDLYAMIAQSAYNNDYSDNLEYYPAGYEVEIDGKKTIAGDGSERQEKVSADNSIVVKSYELLSTPQGDIAADKLDIGSQVISDIGVLTVVSMASLDNANDVRIVFAK